MTVIEPTIFKAYDIRGKVGAELNPDVANAIGAAFGSWLPEAGAVAVGRDMRPDSEALANALIEGLRSQGREVWDIGQVTSDMIYFVVGHYKLAGGAVVTASHNPGEYNGIKLCREEARPVGEATGLLEVRDLAGTNLAPAANPGTVIQKDVAEDWITHVLSFIEPDKLKDLKVVVDAGNGMAGKIFPELEPYVPWEITELYFELDGTFPNHEANPLKFETLTDLIKIVKEKKLDGGIAFDGDGDRAFLIDETGTVLTGGVVSAMLAEYFLRLHPGSTIVYDVRNSRSVKEVIEANGGTALRTKVGHAPIKVAMREHDAPFGGEASGHFYFRDNWYADSGLIGAVIGLYVAGLTGKKLSELREQYTLYEAIPETNFVVEDKEGTMKKIAAAFEGTKQDWLDGITVDMGTAWFNVRPSNTEPLLRVNIETKTKEELEQLTNRVIQLIQP